MTSAQRRHPRRGQGGQAILEFAMFFTFFMFLLAGVTDLAGLLDAHMNVVYAARQGARTGAVMGLQGAADCAVVGAVQAALTFQPNMTLTQIIIFKADPVTGLNTTGFQQIYPGNADCVNGVLTQAAQAGSNWAPSLRVNTPFAEDSIGVQLTYSFQWQFNLLGSGTFQAADAAVYPINPAGEPTPIPTNTV
jgi:hypothetical protein